MKYNKETRDVQLSNGRLMSFLAGSFLAGYFPDDVEWYSGPLTPEERKEIAEYMISLWNEWAKGT